MDEETRPESPGDDSKPSAKPLAFVIDFSDGRGVDLQRHKTLVEKYKNRHKRGESLSKIETVTSKKQPQPPTSCNLPRKSSFQSDGYFSSDESKTAKGNLKRDLSLQLKDGPSSSKMTQSFPNSLLSNVASPDIDIKDISSPEFDLISPLSPVISSVKQFSSSTSTASAITSDEKFDLEDLENVGAINNETFVDGSEFDFDRSDTVSDTGTYTLDADNYSEDQKLRMSIDREFKIASMSGMEKTEEYVKSLGNFEKYLGTEQIPRTKLNLDVNRAAHSNDKLLLSPILSPTQNLSITDKAIEGEKCGNVTKLVCGIKENGLDNVNDHGSVISVTSSGVFRATLNVKPKTKENRINLTTSEVQVETYVDEIASTRVLKPQEFSYKKIVTPKLSANVINVQNISIKSKDMYEDDSDVEVENNSGGETKKISGKTVKNNNESVLKFNGISSKIPSPIHLPFRSRNYDFPDPCLDTETFLNSTQSCINSLQRRILLSEQEETVDKPYEITLNNAQSILKQSSHVRHNSLDGKGVKISNKLEHFQSKNFNIDQTGYLINNKLGSGGGGVGGSAQYCNTTKIQNSPINSPIRRSSSFSTTKNQNCAIKVTNIQKELSVARHKIDRNKFGDTTESSSEEDYEKNSKKRDTLLTSTRYNRAFSLRRGRLETENSRTPEIRRKFSNQQEKQIEQRAISVDRKPQPNSPRINDATTVQSRYLSNITAKKVATPMKNVPKSLNLNTPKSQVMSRTDSGRFSMRMSKNCDKNAPKPPTSAKKSSSSASNGGGRSNSSLTSREVDFQNWKRRKSYDPLKAAAEGKRREMEKKQLQGGIMTQSYNENQIHECDSSPSHSSSVHRSQSFHGTAAMEHILVSSEEEEDMTLSADEGFSPPTPSPCELSPARMSIRSTLCRERILH